MWFLRVVLDGEIRMGYHEIASAEHGSWSFSPARVPASRCSVATSSLLRSKTGILDGLAVSAHNARASFEKR